MSQYENSTDPAFRSEVRYLLLFVGQIMQDDRVSIFDTAGKILKTTCKSMVEFRSAPRDWQKFGLTHTIISNSSSLGGDAQRKKTHTQIRPLSVTGISKDSRLKGV